MKTKASMKTWKIAPKTEQKLNGYFVKFSLIFDECLYIYFYNLKDLATSK